MAIRCIDLEKAPLLFIAVVELISRDLYKSHTPKTIVRRWSGSGSRWGSKSPRTVDRVERYFQQTWIESTLGEDGGNVGEI